MQHFTSKEKSKALNKGFIKQNRTQYLANPFAGKEYFDGELDRLKNQKTFSEDQALIYWRILAANRDLFSSRAYKVLLFIARRTLSFNKYEAVVSYKHFRDGIKNKAGNYIIEPCIASDQTISKAFKELREKNFIKYKCVGKNLYTCEIDYKQIHNSTAKEFENDHQRHVNPRTANRLISSMIGKSLNKFITGNGLKIIMSAWKMTVAHGYPICKFKKSNLANGYEQDGKVYFSGGDMSWRCAYLWLKRLAQLSLVDIQILTKSSISIVFDPSDKYMNKKSEFYATHHETGTSLNGLLERVYGDYYVAY